MSSHHPGPTPKKPKRKRYTGFIWPKDASPYSKPTKPSRWLDIFSGKGPDIFLGNTSHPTSYPSKATWSQWSHVAGIVPVKTVSLLPRPFPLYSHSRSPTQVYDFNARKYKEWTPDWHRANYPCAYCCCVPCRDCQHRDARDSFSANRPPQRRMQHWSDCIDPRLLEANEHECSCDVCGTHRWQHDHRNGPIHISDYRCDSLR